MNTVEETESNNTTHEVIPGSDDATVGLDEISANVVNATVRAMPVQPKSISNISGPLMEVTMIDNQTADLKVIHGFRVHFGPKKIVKEASEIFDKCLIQAPGPKVKNQILRRGSLSFSDLTIFDDSQSGKKVDGEKCCPWEINPSDIQLGKRIAVGGFAEVFIGTYQGSFVAVKRLFDRDAAAIQQFRYEVNLLALLRHPNLILFMGYCRTPELSIIYEFMQKGSLFDLLRARQGHLLEDYYIEMILVSVARGMNYLHTRQPPILHLDLKSPNILLDNAWRVKITDFGLSRFRSRTFVTGNTGATGTPHWMAPEAIRAEKVNEKADVYSFGVIIWELLTGKLPWDHLNAVQVIAAVGFKQRKLPRPQHPNHTLLTLMDACLASNCSERPTFAEILNILHHCCAIRKQRTLELNAKDESFSSEQDEALKSPSTLGDSALEPPNSQSFKIGMETVNQEENQNLERYAKYEKSMHSRDGSQLKLFHHPAPSPFSQFANDPISEEDSSSSADKEDPESGFSIQEQGQSGGGMVSPFAALCEEPFDQTLSEGSSSQFQTSAALSEHPDGNVSNHLGRKTQLAVLYNTLDPKVIEQDAKSDHKCCEGNDGSNLDLEDTTIQSPTQPSGMSFFHANNASTNQGWSIKVAEIDDETVKEGIVSTSDTQIIAEPSPSSPCASCSISECSESSEDINWTHKTTWNFNKNTNPSHESSTEGVCLIPPMSFVHKGDEHDPKTNA